MDKQNKFRKKQSIQNQSKNKINEVYGQKFIADHIDAEIEFYWAIKATVEVPKNKVLTGMAQFIQKNITKYILLGVLRNGHFHWYTSTNFQDFCNRSLNETIIVDQFNNGYTGKDFLDIIYASS